MGACDICQSEQAEYLIELNSYKFYRCQSCRHIFLRPMPSQEDLNALYSNNDADQGEVTPYPKAASRKRRSFFGALKFLPLVRSKRAVDLGCGGGFMAEALRKMGAEAYGIDVDEQAIHYAEQTFPKCTFVNRSFHEMEQQFKGYFDFVYSSEVIEHVNELNAYLAFIQTICKPGGYVYITTPDEGSPRRPAALEDWDVFYPPIHVRFFNRENLSQLFDRYGFRLIKQYSDRKCGLKVLFQKA